MVLTAPHEETKIKDDDPSPSGSARFALKRESDGDTTSSEDETAALRELKEKLCSIPHDQKSALVHVQRVQPGLTSDEHMLQFLRVEDFNVDLALKRFVGYWEERYRVFGPDKYSLPMTLDGAMKDSIDVLRMGFHRILPVRDEAGRAIIYHDSSQYEVHPLPPTEQNIRVMWYVVHLALEMPDVAENGFVILINASGLTVNNFDANFLRAMQNVDKIMPIIRKVTHLCNSNPIIPFVATTVMKPFMSQEDRDSRKIHNGSDSMILESLAKHHLPAHCLPTDLGGTLQLVPMDKYIRKRLIVEEGVKAKIQRYAENTKSPMAVLDNGGSQVYSMIPEKQVPSHELLDNAKPASASTESSPTDRKMPAKEQCKNSGHKKRKGDGPSQVPAKKSVATAKLHHGRHGDPRMKLAVEARVADPGLSLLDALIAGGFVFPGLDEPGVKVGDVLDRDGVSVYQRRNQLLRRLRKLKNKAS